MITALHALLYSEDPPATRAFLRDILGWPYLEDTNSEPGWLIFRSGPSELGVHPNSWTYGGESRRVPIHHEVSLMCDDLAATMRELSAKRSEEHTSELQSQSNLVCRLLLEKKKNTHIPP